MEQSTANTDVITMPETFGDFEILLPSTISSEYVFLYTSQSLTTPFSLLPEAEEGLFTLNVAKAVDITIAPEAPMEALRQSSTQLSLDGLSQVDVAHLNSVTFPFLFILSSVVAGQIFNTDYFFQRLFDFAKDLTFSRR